MEQIKKELTEIRDKFGDERKTNIENVMTEIDIEDLIEEEESVFTLTHGGYIKRMPTSTYQSQNRGGKGMKGMKTKEEDFVENILIGFSSRIREECTDLRDIRFLRQAGRQRVVQ